MLAPQVPVEWKASLAAPMTIPLWNRQHLSPLAIEKPRTTHEFKLHRGWAIVLETMRLQASLETETLQSTVPCLPSLLETDVKHLSAAILCGLFIAAPLSVSAQDIDIDALMADIEQRSGQYEQLIGILQGTDANRALAAFDAMVASGNATMTEVAINTGLLATDSRLRARALWEALSRKDSMTTTVDTSALENDEKAALNEWVGPVQTWTLYQKFPDTQCVNLDSSASCYPGRHLSVSGLRVDMTTNYASGISAQFALDESGVLVGTIMNRATMQTYPARIEFR